LQANGRKQEKEETRRAVRARRDRAAGLPVAESGAQPFCSGAWRDDMQNEVSACEPLAEHGKKTDRADEEREGGPQPVCGVFPWAGSGPPRLVYPKRLADSRKQRAAMRNRVFSAPRLILSVSRFVPFCPRKAPAGHFPASKGHFPV
jgi:hypothetical protein